MTSRERMTRFIKGQSTDKVPFVQYDNMGGKNEDIWNVVGKDNMGILVWTDPYNFEHEKCFVTSEKISSNGKLGFLDTMHTPVGNLTQRRFSVPELPGVEHIEKFYITCLADYKILLSYLSDIKVNPDSSKIEEVWKYVGQNGVPHVWIGRTPFQQLWIQWVSMMDLSFHMADDPVLLGEVTDLLGEVLVKAAETTIQISKQVEIPYLVIGDNITAPLIGPERFKKYCLPYYKKVSKIISEIDIPLVVHMDGDLKPLWHLIKDSGVGALDSFSPPPDNDTSAAVALQNWPNMKLLLNFPSSIHLENEETIYKKTMEILDEAGATGNLQIQISENPPPNCWRKSYPQIIRAINNFSNN